MIVLLILFLAISPLSGSDLEQVAGDLAERIVAWPNPAGSVNLTTRANATVAVSELRELQRLVADELRKRRIKLSPEGLTISMSFSEALRGRLLIAEIRTREGGPQAIILPVPARSRANDPLRRVSLQKSLVWRQDEPILDFVVMPGNMLILSPAKVSLVADEEHGWKERHSWDLRGIAPFPRDPRGRLLFTGSEFRAYLPRHECHAAVEPGSSLTCEPSDRGWPVGPAESSDIHVRLAAGKNYFDQLRPAKRAPVNLPPFYSAASVAVQQGSIWALTTLEGDARFYDPRPAEIGRARGWGTNLASLQIPDCGSWILAVTNPEAGNETLQAFEWAGDRAIAGSERLELDGVSTALWADEGSRVRLVTRDLKSGRYAAWSVALVCAD